MIVIVDNGKGAEDIAKIIRATARIATPKEAPKLKASAYVLSDGSDKQNKLNTPLIKKSNIPILAVGNAHAFMLSAFGAKPLKGKFPENSKLNMEHPCSLLLDMKKSFAVKDNCTIGFEDIPESFDVYATSKDYPFELLGHAELPFFALHFNPELGMDGIKILQNFSNFVEIWGKYHK